MDFNLNDEQELFVAGIRELMASENWEAYFAECDRDSVYPERFVKALADMGIDSLLICGMMTQNCVVFTAMSELTGGRDIAVVGDLCAAPSQVVHLVALAALGSKRKMADAASLWP